MAPFPWLTSYPPLGQLSTIPADQGQICVTVLVEWNKARPQYPFELALCYTSCTNASSHPSTWTTVTLQESQNPSIVEQEDAFRSTFQNVQSLNSITSEFGNLIHFTVKYRVNSFAPWQWVQTQQGTTPGRILVQRPILASGEDISQHLHLAPDWSANRASGTPETVFVYELKTGGLIPKSDAGEDEEKLSDKVLGRVPGQLQYLALVRLERYWMGPRQGGDQFYLAEDALLCAFLTNTGQILTILTITGIDDTYSVIHSNEMGEIVVAARCDSDKDVHFHAIASIANTFEESCSAALTFASQIVNSQPLAIGLSREIRPSSDKSDALFEAWLDGLGFCTWNGLGQNLTEEKILSALRSLADNNITISALLIDDNWQTVGPIPGHDYSDSFFRGFSDIHCNQSVAPEGLSALITKIKAAHPGITDIGVWHALMGYWGGISPSGQIAKDYKTVEVPAYLMGNIPATMTSVAGPALSQFYDDFYSYIAGSGVTFIKTDVQHMLSTFRTRSSRLALINAYQAAWTTAHNKHFQSKAISCMSQTPQNLYASLMQTHTPRVVLRNSDDFYPEVAASHPWHIWANAHNALFTRHLNVCPDWDMFQTSHSYSSYHAAARCISGGPILITDVPGEHDTHLIRQMTGLDKTGRSIALRPGMARTTRVFDEYTDGHSLKIGSVTRGNAWRASLLGLWNLSGRTEGTLTAVSEFIDVRNIAPNVLVRSFKTGQVFGPFDTSAGVDNLVYTAVSAREWDILTAYPVLRPVSGREDVAVAVLGLGDKISGAAGVLDVTTSASDTSLSVRATLRALGRLSLWISPPADGPDTNVDVKLQGHRVASNVVQMKSLGRCTLLDVDVESEWKGRKLFDSEQDSITVEIEVRL